MNGQGTAQIKFVTRSGSNEFHGSVYEYYRNDKFNANSWFNNRDLPPDPKTGKAPRTQLRQHQPGFRVGGPIMVPGIFNGRNRAFFFVNYEEFRQPSTRTIQRVILNPAAEQGTFRYSVSGQVRELNLLQLAAGNGHAATPDPVTSKTLADIRAATKKTGNAIDLVNPLLQQYTFQQPTQSLNKYPTVRIDYNISQKHRLTGSMNYQTIDSTPDTTNNQEPSFPGFPITGSQKSTRWTTSESLRSTLSSNMVNEFRFGSTGGATFFSPEFEPSLWKDYGGFNLSFRSACCGTGNFLQDPGVAGTTTTAGNPTIQVREASTTVFEDTLSWIKGRHSLSFGGSFLQADLWIKNQMLVPTVQFGIVPGDPADGMFVTGNFPGASTQDITNAKGLYAILVGRVSSIAADARLNEGGDKYVPLGLGLARGRMREFDFFAADSHRLTSTLTVNYGLRYVLSLPFYPLNSSYSTATKESLWGVSGVDNLFNPGVLNGRPTEFIRYDKGQYAYNVDKNNFAPTIGFAWSPVVGSRFLQHIFGGQAGDSVFRGGYGIAYERRGMADFSGVFGANPGLRIQGARDQTSGNLGQLPVLLRDSAAMSLPTFVSGPSYPMKPPAITNSLNIFDSNIQIPYAESWTLGWQRKLGHDMAVEVRYVGSRHLQDWVVRNINEINIVENGFLNEFKLAQQNLQANIAGGRGNSFRYAGPGTGTNPLPIMLAYFQGLPSSQAGNTANYTSTNFTNTTFVNALAIYGPNPCCTTSSFASTLFNDAGRRANAANAGLSANFFVANPDLLGSGTTQGVNLTGNGGFSRYDSLQLELRKRLSKGLVLNTNYSFGNQYEWSRYSQRKPQVKTLDVGTVGSVTHAFKGNWVYDLPFGRNRRFASNAGGLLDRIVGGWQFDGVTRIQSGRLLDFGNVRLVGMSTDEFKKAFGVRAADNGQLYLLPQDIIDNTVKAFQFQATSPTGYGAQGPPSGRYLAPANGPDCIEVAQGFGDCGTRSLVVTGPRLVRWDLSAVKKIKVVENRDIEVRGEFLNAFNTPYFTPITGLTTTNTAAASGTLPLGNASNTGADSFRIVSLAGDNTSRIIQLVVRFTW
jgi:hypothetical protein